MKIGWVWACLDLPEAQSDVAVEFWRAVTRTEVSPWRGDRGQLATLLPAAGDPWVKVQRVGGDGGVHVDLAVDVPLPEAAQRAVSLGAEVVNELDDVVVCRSPGGMAFCLTQGDPARPSRGEQVRRGSQSLLDQICLDMPRRRYAAEVAFWSAVTGWPVEPDGEEDEFERLAWPGGLPVRFLLQRLDDEDGPVRAHVDLAAADRPAEVARHVELGAVEVGPGRGWTVLRDPVGRTYCVTDRHPLTGGAPPS